MHYYENMEKKENKIVDKKQNNILNKNKYSTEIISSKKNKKNKAFPICLKKAKSNQNLLNRAIKVSLSNPNYSIENIRINSPSTTAILYNNLQSSSRQIISNVSIENAAISRNSSNRSNKK